MKAFFDTRCAFVAIVAVGLFAMAARTVTDPDVWWHLRTGQLILQNHAVFHTDPYSFTKFGQPWVNHEWLSDVLIFGLYRAAGFAGLVVTFAAITSAAFMLVFLRCDGRPYLAAAFTVWAAMASVPSWGVRPQTLSLFFASLFLFLLERSYSHPKVLWYTLPLMLIWVNLHAGFAIGIAFMVLFLAGDLLDMAFGLEEWSWRTRLKNLAIATAACLAVIPLNPYGTGMYWYPVKTVYSKSIEGYISEWISPNFHRSTYLPVLLLILAILIAAAISPLRLKARELLLLSAMTLAALHSARHVPLLALVAAPILSNLIYSWLREKKFFGSAAKGSSQRPGSAIVNGIGLAAFLLFCGFRVSHVLSTQSDAEKSSFPVSAVSFLKANRLPGPLFNSYNWGGYLIWRLYPEYRVYVDGRSDLYGDSFLNQFAATYQLSGPSWRAVLDGWGIKTVLLPPDAPLVSALRLSANWKQVYEDPQAVVWHKTEPHGNQ